MGWSIKFEKAMFIIGFATVRFIYVRLVHVRICLKRVSERMKRFPDLFKFGISPVPGGAMTLTFFLDGLLSGN